MNEHTLEKLSLLLIRQIELQKKLLALQEHKTKILVEGNIKELDDILIQEQPLILHCAGLEKQRVGLLHEMGLTGRTLREIRQECDPEGEYGIAGISEELKEILIKIKKKNRFNQKILESRLAVIGQCMSVIGLTENILAYKENRHY